MDHSPGFLAHVLARTPRVTEVSVTETQRALGSNPNAQLLDVREDREWDAAHAVGATHVARGVIERDIERLVPAKDTPLYLYCGGGFRSALAADSLQQMGYSNVYSVDGGWRSWQEAGAPMEGPAAPADALRFPIGKHVRQDTYTADERAAFIARFAAQPAALAAALSGMTEAQHEHPYRPGGWTVRQVVHHVADSHMHMYIRIKLALSATEPTINAYDQEAWVHMADVHMVSPMVSVSLFATVHERLVAALRSLTPADFARGLIHPDNGRMTVEQVVAMYAWHGDHHIAHIRNVKTA